MSLRKTLIFFILVFALSSKSIHSTFIKSDYITVVFLDTNTVKKIPLKHVKDESYFSSEVFSRVFKLESEWDFVSGILNVSFNDVDLKIPISGNYYQLNGVWKFSRFKFFQEETDCWVPVSLLNEIVNVFFEGDVIWFSEKGEIKVFPKNEDHKAVNVGMSPYIVVIDPGHGGGDRGCFDIVSQMYEKDLALSMALSLSKILEDRLGVDVKLTRTVDAFVSNEKRTAIANNAKADLFISIHFAPKVCETSHSGKSFSIYYFEAGKDRDGYKRKEFIREWGDIDHTVCERSKKIAEKFRKVLSESTDLDNGCLMSGNLSVLKGLQVPGILLEMSFESSFYGNIPVSDPSGRRRAVESIFDSIRSIILESE